MGVIGRQSIQDSVLKIGSLIIGVASMLWIYPLNHKAYGALNTIYSASQLLIPFIGLGASTVAVKFFVDFKKETKESNNLLLVVYILNLLGVVMLLLLGFIIGTVLTSLGILDNIDFLNENKVPIFVIAIFLSITTTTARYISNYGKIVIPNMLMEFSYKIFLPALILLSTNHLVTEGDLRGLYVLFFILSFLGIMTYGYRLDIFKNMGMSISTLINYLKRISSFALFSILTILGSIIAFRIDAIMLTSLLDVESTGLYLNVLIISSTIAIPSVSLAKIAGPIISESFANNDLKRIDSIYKKSSINALIIAIYIFYLIWFNLDSLFLISSKPDAFIGASAIFLFLAAGRLLDVATSVNNPIISYSKYYKYNVFFLIILAVSNVVFNLVFIRAYGVVGASMATCLSLLIFNAVKFTFIYSKYGFTPFSNKTLSLFIIAIIAFISVNIIPTFENPFISIIVTSAIISVLYGFMIIRFEVSKDINDMLQKQFLRILPKS